ncbi:MAG: hypothetical protein WB041_29925, partial [Pseudolabrys sp.]
QGLRGRPVPQALAPGRDQGAPGRRDGGVSFIDAESRGWMVQFAPNRVCAMRGLELPAAVSRVDPKQTLSGIPPDRGL